MVDKDMWPMTGRQSERGVSLFGSAVLSSYGSAERGGRTLSAA